MAPLSLLRAAAFGLLPALLASHGSSQFVVDTGKLPSGALVDSTSENVDFGDVDLDGDWDIAVADGGDDGDDQNQLWINQGGAQGGTRGVFLDETATQCPPVLDDSRDVEFADIDNDGDLDLYVSNTSQISPQGNRWWANLGGKQGGTLGFYADETAARWVGLGGTGSSIPPSQLIAPGSFIDWSCDCDFGDLDNDGDLDLIHASYGQAFAGNVPTRLFLNDGDGRFSEFNPSGFQVPIATIANGNPGLWCEGVQQGNTLDSTGFQCDIAASTLDVDVADIDGDFDLDMLLGARDEAPRMFVNRLDGSSLVSGVGALAFRDMSSAVFPPGYWLGNGHYEQEFGDLDRDGDLDLIGLNWQNFLFSWEDTTLENNGDGTYAAPVLLAASEADDNESDFLDYDNDGDLDLYIANFGGNDKLYRNDWAGAGYSFTEVSLPAFASISLDADACDVDGDGDYDIVVAEDDMQANTLLTNVTDVPDASEPYLPSVEALGDHVAAAGQRPVRVQVYDNAPYYITWYNDTVLRVTVDGVSLPAFAARSSAGQIFRAELPANLVGAIDYAFTSEDEYGNTGSSAGVALTGTYGPSFQSTFGASTVGLTGGEPTVRALSVPFAGSRAFLALESGAAPGTAAVLAIGTQAIPPLTLNGILTLNIGGTALAVVNAPLNAGGDVVVGPTVPPGMTPGTHFFAQGWVFDPTAGGEILASSKGLDIVTQ